MMFMHFYNLYRVSYSTPSIQLHFLNNVLKPKCTWLDHQLESLTMSYIPYLPSGLSLYILFWVHSFSTIHVH